MVTVMTCKEFMLDIDWDQVVLVGSTGPYMMHWSESLLWRSETLLSLSKVGSR